MPENRNDEPVNLVARSNRFNIVVGVIVVTALLIGVFGYKVLFKKTGNSSSTTNQTAKSNPTAAIQKSITGTVQKLEIADDSKSGILFIKAGSGLPQENKPMVVYQVQVDDSVLVNSISPAKSASETKPVSVPIKWKDIKVNKYINVNLNKELGSATAVKLSSIKNIEVIEN